MELTPTRSFFISRSLKCDRIRVHKHFMMSLIIRYVVSVIYYEPYIYGDPKPSVWFRDNVSSFTIDCISILLFTICVVVIILDSEKCICLSSFKGYLCKLLLVLLMYGHVAPVFWMFVEGKHKTNV